MKTRWKIVPRWIRVFRAVLASVVALILAAPAFAQGGNSPWENAVNVLETAFTSTIARGLSLVAIVVAGLTFAFGHVYSFLLTEISDQPKVEPDLKIFVEPKEGSGIAGSSGLRGYVSASEAEAYKKELDAMRSQTADQVRAAKAEVVEQVNRFRSSYATKLQFDYSLDPQASREPFLVAAIYHDESFTYIQCAAREKPALYEIKDGKPNLISFQFENGVYIAPKVIDSGYLAIGKKKLSFARRAGAN